jgi:L-alanine-DL-glutamate epimerase-like enolase superfamily enzyme
MKITRVDPILVALPYEHGAPKPKRTGLGTWETQDILLVRVETDAGIVGWGEAFSNSSTPVTVPAIARVIAKLATGRDATDIPALMADLTRRTQSMGRAGPIAFALSGLDIALWDIAGKAAGQPVYRLLGGAEKASIPAYASLFRLGTPDTVARITATAAERGYRDIKLHEHSIENVAAARSAVGAGIGIMVDTNCHWSSADAVVAACRDMEPYDVAWLEEPLYPADAYPELSWIRAGSNVPIAAGENMGNFNDVRRAIEATAVDVVQPSVAKIGGITETWKILQYARDQGVRAVPHSPFSGPALIAAMHMIAALPDEVSCEHRFCDLGANPLGRWGEAQDGRLAVPQAPGLGFEVDLDIVEKYRVDVPT